MFDQQPEARMVPPAFYRNNRTNSWIVVVSNRTFVSRVQTLYPAERLAWVLPQLQREAPCSRFDLLGALEVLLALLLAGGWLTAAWILWR
jgi:hypothetical protein